MGFWDAISGRRKQPAAKADALFAVPTAALTLETTLGLRPSGSAAVCLRAAAGPAFEQTRAEIRQLLDADPRVPAVRVVDDGFGFTWFDLDRAEAQVGELCADLHIVHQLLSEQGYGTGMLCAVVGFRPGGPAEPDADGQLHGTLGLVYLYKQGTFYPFAPGKGAGDGAGAARTRDQMLEMQVADAVAGDLPMERDRDRWFGLWGTPAL